MRSNIMLGKTEEKHLFVLMLQAPHVWSFVEAMHNMSGRCFSQGP